MDGPVSWLRVGAFAILGTVSLVLLAGWDALYPVILVPVVAGAALGLSLPTRREALLAGAFAGVMGAIISALVYTPESIERAIAGLPTWANISVAVPVYKQLMVPILEHGLFYSASAGGRIVLFPLLAVAIITPAVAWGANALYARRDVTWAAPVAGWAVIAVLCVSFLYVGYQANAPWMKFMNSEPPAGDYGYDGVMNLKTYYLMEETGSFYPAYVAAHDADSRSITPVENGKFTTVSPTMLRQPTMFYFWRAIAPGGRGENVLVASLIVGALILVATYWALFPMVGYAALFVGPVLFPALLVHSGAANPLFPDWWAAVAFLFSVCALVRGRWVTAGVFALIAMLFRETFAAWLLAMALVYAISAVRDKSQRLPVAVFTGLFAAGVVAFMIHVRAGTDFIAVPKSVSNIVFGSRGIAAGLLSPLGYLMFPYGPLAISTLLLVPLGLAGLWVGLRSQPKARLATIVYIVMVVAYFAVFGAPSQYWGQMVTLLLLIGVTLFLGSADVLADRATWRLVPTGLRDAAEE